MKEPVGFDDEDAWGYCSFCAFMVASERVDGKLILLPHHRAIGTATAKAPCAGRGTEATVQPSPEAKGQTFWMMAVEEPEGESDDDDTDSSGGD